MASEWLKPPTMVPTTFLSFYPTVPPLLTASLPPPPPPLFPRSCPTTPIAWMHRPSLFNAIQAHRSCQSGSGSLEAPWRYTKSAKRRKRGGRSTRRRRHREERRRRRFLVFFFFPPPPPTGSLALISAAVFLAHRIFSWKYQRICTKSHFESLPHMLKCQIHKQTCVCTILSPFKQLSSFWTNSSSPFFSPLSSPPLRSTLACHTSPSPGPDCRAPVM